MNCLHVVFSSSTCHLHYKECEKRKINSSIFSDENLIKFSIIKITDKRFTKHVICLKLRVKRPGMNTIKNVSKLIILKYKDLKQLVWLGG